MGTLLPFDSRPPKNKSNNFPIYFGPKTDPAAGLYREGRFFGRGVSTRSSKNKSNNFPIFLNQKPTPRDVYIGRDIFPAEASPPAPVKNNSAFLGPKTDPATSIKVRGGHFASSPPPSTFVTKCVFSDFLYPKSDPSGCKKVRGDHFLFFPLPSAQTDKVRLSDFLGPKIDPAACLYREGHFFPRGVSARSPESKSNIFPIFLGQKPTPREVKK